MRHSCRRQNSPVRAGGVLCITIVLIVAMTGLILGVMPGCDGGGTSATAQYPDMGVTMSLPPGWTMGRDGVHYQRTHRDDHFGTVYGETLMAATLEAHVRTIIERELDQASYELAEVADHQAVELITRSAASVYEMYILRGEDEVVVVSFRTLPEAFEEQVESFRAAVRSIRFQ